MKPLTANTAYWEVTAFAWAILAGAAVALGVMWWMDWRRNR